MTSNSSENNAVRVETSTQIDNHCRTSSFSMKTVIVNNKRNGIQPPIGFDETDDENEISLISIEKSACEWNVNDVSIWLKLIENHYFNNIEKYSQLFSAVMENNINGQNIRKLLLVLESKDRLLMHCLTENEIQMLGKNVMRVWMHIAMATNVIREGWIEKRTIQVKIETEESTEDYKKQWTVLYTCKISDSITKLKLCTFNRIKYFSDLTESEECIDLNEYFYCKPLPTKETDFEVCKLDKNGHGFRCSSKEERNEWCFSIISNLLHSTLVNEQHMKTQLIQGFLRHIFYSLANVKTKDNIVNCNNQWFIPPLVHHLVDEYFIFDGKCNQAQEMELPALISPIRHEFRKITKLINVEKFGDGVQCSVALMIKHPFNFQCHQYLAYSLARSGEKLKAGKHYEIAIWLKPFDSQNYLEYARLALDRNSRKYKNCMEHALQLLEKSPSTSSFTNSECAQYLENEMRFEESEQFYELAMEINPKNAIAKYTHMLSNIGQTKKAEEIYKKYIPENEMEVDEKHSMFCMLYGQWLTKKPTMKEAEHYLYLAKSQKREKLECIRNYAILLRNLRRYTECYAQFDECLALDPLDYNTLGNIAIAHRDQGIGSYDKAEEFYQKTFEANADSVAYVGGYGHLMYLTKEWEKAEELIAKAINYSPRNYNYRYYHALLLKYHSKDYQNAEIAFNSSINNRSAVQENNYGPHIAECNYEFGLLLYENMNKKMESIEYFKLAIDCDIHHTRKYVEKYQIALESQKRLKTML